eukprot:9978665-Lingulodinium_polyedra.AAC.1
MFRHVRHIGGTCRVCGQYLGEICADSGHEPCCGEYNVAAARFDGVRQWVRRCFPGSVLGAFLWQL